jgi:hypothetical protein
VSASPLVPAMFFPGTLRVAIDIIPRRRQVAGLDVEETLVGMGGSPPAGALRARVPKPFEAAAAAGGARDRLAAETIREEVPTTACEAGVAVRV